MSSISLLQVNMVSIQMELQARLVLEKCKKMYNCKISIFVIDSVYDAEHNHSSKSYYIVTINFWKNPIIYDGLQF